MHENREISCTSWPENQDRSAKAMNRTADVNVQEKSDCAVVPVNQPNNEGQQPSAEAGEGRAQTEENIVQSHMPPTQSGERLSQGLHGVRQAVRRHSSTVRAVCVNAPVRICAGAISDGRPYRDSYSSA
jgi:RNA-directed DNA polymerase